MEMFVTRKFLRDFPEMANIKRGYNKSPQDYFYKMVAIGSKAYLPESAIIRHIINGVHDPHLRKKKPNN